MDLATAKARLREYLKDMDLDELVNRLFRQAPRADQIAGPDDIDEDDDDPTL